MEPTNPNNKRSLFSMFDGKMRVITSKREKKRILKGWHKGIVELSDTEKNVIPKQGLGHESYTALCYTDWKRRQRDLSTAQRGDGKEEEEYNVELEDEC